MTRTTTRRRGFAVAAGAALLIAGAVWSAGTTPASALTGPGRAAIAVQEAAQSIDVVQEARRVCRRVWRCNRWGCGWRTRCWWEPNRRWRDRYWRHRHWRRW